MSSAARDAMAVEHVRRRTGNVDLERREALHAAADAAVRRALDLAPGLPQAHLAMAWYFSAVEPDYEAAFREADIAAAGMPGEAEPFAMLKR